MIKIFIHGVPDTPAIWEPILNKLRADPKSADHVFVAPSLPGFETPPPKGFTATKDAYAEWLIGELENWHDKHGKIDLIGHDWGALLVLRAACLRPELINSWAVSNALIDPLYQGHRLARIWAKPVLGELIMLTMRSSQFEKALQASGIPKDIAAKEAQAWRNWHMRRCILRLYRSAAGLRFSGPWVDDLRNLPAKGLIIWGENDPYVPLEVAQRFSKERNIPLAVEHGASHWAIAERADSIAITLKNFWAEN